MISSNWRKTPQYSLWRANVYARDGWKCALCTSNKKIEAHHIKPCRTYPELSLNENNGITLCFRCHRTIFGKEDLLEKYFEDIVKNAVNSGKLPPGNTEDNPEPSSIGNNLEGVTTRRRGYILEQFINKQIPCSQCQSILERHHYRVQKTKNFFCNQTCKKLFMKGKAATNKKQNIVKNCTFCKSEMSPTPSDIHRNKQFCNNSCHSKWLWQIQKRQPSDILKGKWTKKYGACVICNKTDIKHYGKGKCMKCYNKEYASNSPMSAVPERDDIVWSA